MKLKILLNLLLLLTAGIGYGQNVVTGTVTDESGDPLPGVSIVVKGTSNGTITGIDGKYSVQIDDQGGILVFSFVGYANKEILISNQTEISIVLEEDITELEEIIVIGYGSQKKKDITSSIGQVDSNDIENVAATYSFDGAIQGKLSGVNISSSSATPGSAFNINVRGVTSVNASSQPLIVIDGIPVISSDRSALNGNIQPVNPLANINPNEIASISVLKDASAAAIYGTRGANGVILITTKRGSVGNTKINVGYYTGVSEITNVPEMMNSREWINFMNTAAEFDGLGENYWNDILGDPNDPNLRDVNVYDEILRTGITHNADLSLSGGDAKTKFYISGNFFDQSGIQIGQGFKRYSARMNLDHSVNDKFGITTNLSLSRSDHQRTINENDEYGVIINAQAWDPTAPLKNEDGSYTNPFSYGGWWALENPLFIAEQYVNQSRSNRVLASTIGDWQITEKLSFKSSWSIDYNTLDEESFTPVGGNEAPNGAGLAATLEEFNWINENTLSYSIVSDKHNINILGGFSIQDSQTEFSEISGTNYPSNQITKVQAAAVTTASASSTSFGFLSYIGRVTYDYAGKYLLQASVRTDASSRFGPDNRYGFFPSGSIGWRFTNESFMDVITPVLTNGKIRVSYGRNGNAEIGNFTWRDFWGSASYNGRGGTSPSVLGNTELGWETTTQLDIGIDLAILDRFTITADYFNKETTNLLLDADVPGSLGFFSTFSNIGNIRNKGYEASIGAQVLRTSGFQWNASANFTKLKNRVVDVLNNGQIISRNFILLEGESLSQLNLIKFLGVDPTTGDAVFEDLNSDGIIDLDDRQPAGTGIPTYFGGVTNNFSYKGFNLSVFFQFSGGNKIFNQSRHAFENYGTTRNAGILLPYGNQLKRSLDHWKEPGDITDIPRPSIIGPDDASGAPLQWQRFSTQYLEDGDFVRLKNIKLSYDFGAEILSKMKLSSLNLYVQAQNLKTWTDYLGFDPEVNTNTSGDGLNTQLGEDFGTLGQARTFSVGINVGL